MADDQRTSEKSYPKWVGVLIAFFVPGVVHYLTGNKRAGALWFAGIMLADLGGVAMLLAPGDAVYVAFLILGAAFVGAFVFMLVRSYRPVRRMGLKGWLVYAAVLAALIVPCRLARRACMESFRIHGDSMSPTLATGERVIVDKLCYRSRDPRRGELVMFRHFDLLTGEEKVFVKRVVGMPDEKVQIHPPHVVIEGRKLVEPRIFTTIATGAGEYAGYHLIADAGMRFERLETGHALAEPEHFYRVGRDEYYLLGDNSAKSYDCRFYGGVKREDIIGRTVRVFWPPWHARTIAAGD